MGPLLGRGAPCQAISLSSYTKGTSRQATMAPCQTKRAPRQAHGDPYKATGTLSSLGAPCQTTVSLWWDAFY